MSEKLTAADVKPHADALDEIRAALEPFKPEVQMVILAGALGSTLCTVGLEPDRNTAVMLMGSSVEMILDMIDRYFPATGATS